MKKPILIITVFLTVVIASACSSSSSSSLTGVKENPWGLMTLNQENLPEGTQITLKFESDQITGSAGCNIYSASYKASGNSLTFGQIVQTEKACMEPAGVMEQEKSYLEILGAAQSFAEVDGLLTIISNNGQTLTYQRLPSSGSSPVSTTDEQTYVSQTNPAVEPAPTQTPEIIEPPAGFKEYLDSQTGISIYIPEEWYIQDQSVVEGEYAIFSSYPPDKYIGGEAREPGDTKCDLNLNGSASSAEALVQEWQSSSITTIVSEEEIVLNSGKPATVFVIDSMGRSTIMVTEIGNRLVIFTCWGEFEYFDEIAVTLHATYEK